MELHAVAGHGESHLHQASSTSDRTHTPTYIHKQIQTHDTTRDDESRLDWESNRTTGIAAMYSLSLRTFFSRPNKTPLFPLVGFLQTSKCPNSLVIEAPKRAKHLFHGGDLPAYCGWLCLHALRQQVEGAAGKDEAGLVLGDGVLGRDEDLLT